MATTAGSDINKQIAFIDLAAQQKRIRTQIDSRIARVLDHGQYILGPEVKELEKKLADFVGVRHCIGVSSGTDALLMALMTKGIGPGDAVFTTPFTFIATAEVISLLGATPVFVDINPNTFNMDPDNLALAIQAVKEKDNNIYPIPLTHDDKPLPLTPRAIIPVDLFGLPADYDSIIEIANIDDLFVLEDAAQGLGGVYKGRQAGGLGHVAATSFFPAKPLGCYGDGGAVLTDDDALAEQILSIRMHGKGTDKYDNIRIGLNARLHTMQAAILLSKLEIFTDELQTKQHIAEQYTEKIEKFSKQLKTPHVPVGLRSAWAQYSLVSPNRASFQNALKEAGVPSMVYYPTPLHLQTAYSSLNYKKGDMPNSERISEEIFSLPMHPYLKDEDINLITRQIESD